MLFETTGDVRRAETRRVCKYATPRAALYPYQNAILVVQTIFRHTHFKGLNLDKNRTCILVIFGDGRIWFSACRLNNLFHHINHYQENIQTKEMLLIQL